REPIRVLGCIASGESRIISTPLGQLSVVGDDEWATENLPVGTGFVLAIGNGKVREMLAAKYEAKGFVPVSLVHPTAQFSDSVQIGEGSLVCANAILTVDVRLGKHCI